MVNKILVFGDEVVDWIDIPIKPYSNNETDLKHGKWHKDFMTWCGTQGHKPARFTCGTPPARSASKNMAKTTL